MVCGTFQCITCLEFVIHFWGMVLSGGQQRIIRCGGAVDDDMANLIVAQLLYLDAADPNRVRLTIELGN